MLWCNLDVRFRRGSCPCPKAKPNGRSTIQRGILYLVIQMMIKVVSINAGRMIIDCDAGNVCNIYSWLLLCPGFLTILPRMLCNSRNSSPHLLNSGICLEFSFQSILKLLFYLIYAREIYAIIIFF